MPYETSWRQTLPLKYKEGCLLYMKTITLPLETFLNILIRDDEYQCVDNDTATLIESITKNQSLACVQRKDRNGLTLEHPRVWWLNRWRADTESWRMAKLRSDRERDERWIFEENVKRVARAITRETFIEGDAARALAFRKLKSIDKCRKLLTETWGVVLCDNVKDIT